MYYAPLEPTFDMVDYSLASSNSGGAIDHTRSNRVLDASWFNGNPVYTFQVIGYNANTTTAYDVSLYDFTNSAVKATVTIPASTTTATAFSASFTPAAGENHYRVRIPQTAGIEQVRVFAARMAVVQDSSATKTAVSFPLMGYNYMDASNAVVYVDTTPTGTSYGQTVGGRYSRFLKTAANWATVSGCAIDAVISSNSGSYTATAALVDVDNSNTAVTGTTGTASSTALTPYYATFAWADMPDTHNFEFMGKSNNASGACRMSRASLVIFLSDLEKGEVYRRIGLYSSATAAQSMLQTQTYTAANYPSGHTVFFEATGSCSDNADAADCYDLTATPDAAVTGSAINWNSSTKARQRTAAITPTTAHEFYGHTIATTGTQAIVNPMLVIVWAGQAGEYVDPSPDAHDPTVDTRDTETPAETDAVLTADHIEVDFGAELLDANDVFVGDISDDLEGGEITHDNYATIHGSCRLHVTRELAWGTDRIRPYMTVTAPELGLRTYNKLGVYLLTTPDTQLGDTPVTYEVQGYDKLKLLQKPVGDTYVVTAGTAYLTAVGSAITASGATGVSVQLDSTLGATTLTSAMVWMLSPDEEITYLRVVNDLLAAISYRGLWADAEGRYRSEPYQTPADRNVTWSFVLSDPTTNIVGEDRRMTVDEFAQTNWRRFIKRGLTAAPVETAPDTTADTMYTQDDSGGGVKYKKVYYLDVEDGNALYDEAQRIINEETQRKQKVEIPCGPLPVLSHWDTVQYSDDETNLGPVKCQVASWTLPLDGSDMRLQLEVLS